jgi:hypothetical protein
MNEDPTAMTEFNSPFQNKIIRDWFFTNLKHSGDDIFFEGVVTTGSGPFEENDFDEFLRSIDVDVHKSGNYRILIVGQNDWEEIIDRILEIRRGDSVKIYSQEMAMTYLACEKDPFEDMDLLMEFGEQHPALCYLRDIGQWPLTIASGPGGLDPRYSNLLPVGLLKHMGYSVGVQGKSIGERHQALRNVLETKKFRNNLPQDYLNEWGEPGSEERLMKTATTIAALVRNAKNRKIQPVDAIREWELDLDWLKNNFYKGGFWPST